MSWAREPGEQAAFRPQPSNTGVRAKGPCLSLRGAEKRWGHFECQVCKWQLFWKEHIPQCVVSFLVCLSHQAMSFSMARMSSLNSSSYPSSEMSIEWMKSQHIATFWGQMKDQRKGTPREVFTVLPHHFLHPSHTYSFSSNCQCKTQSQDKTSLHSEEKVKNCDARKEMILKKNNVLSILSFLYKFH